MGTAAQFRYTFRYITKCNMCGSPTESHKVLGRRLNQSQGLNPEHKAGISTMVAKCSNCGLIYSNPQPIPFNLQDHYGIPPESYWQEDAIAGESDYGGLIQIFQKFGHYYNNARLLDVGAGIGKCMMSFSQSGFDTYGLEPSQPFYEYAIKKMKISPRKLKLGMVEDADYPNDFFDFITFGAVLEHLYDPSASLQKALQWLKPGGLIHVEVPSADWLVNKLINLFYSLKGTDYVGNISPMHIPFHLYEFGFKSFQEHAKHYGYEIAFHEYYVCDTYLPRFMDFLAKPIMKWTNKGMQLCVLLRKNGE